MLFKMNNKALNTKINCNYKTRKLIEIKLFATKINDK